MKEQHLLSVIVLACNSPLTAADIQKQAGICKSMHDKRRRKPKKGLGIPVRKRGPDHHQEPDGFPLSNNPGESADVRHHFPRLEPL